MLIEQASMRGRSLALNGVCGNFGAALAAGITATLIAVSGWRTAFVVPGVICAISALLYLQLIPSLQFLGVLFAAYATGKWLILALAVAMAAIFGQVTVNDLVIARYTADAWRGRVYAVRYFLTFLVSGAAVSVIAVLYGRGGFGLVLATTAVIALGFVVATAVIAVLVNTVERQKAQPVMAAE